MKRYTIFCLKLILNEIKIRTLLGLKLELKLKEIQVVFSRQYIIV